MSLSSLESVLKELGVEEYYEAFAVQDYDVKSLHYILEDTYGSLKDIIPSARFRAEFVSKLKEWVKRKVPDDATRRTDPLPPGTPESANLNDRADPLSQPPEGANKRNAARPPRAAKRYRKWAGTRSISDLDLKALFEESYRGRTVINKYTRNKVLSKESRTAVVHIVGNKLLDLECRPTGDDYDAIAKKIVALFPSEEEYSYFIRAKSNGPLQKNHEGKIPNFLRNTRNRTKDEIEDEDEPENLSVNNEYPDDILNAVGWLKGNLDPWDEVRRKWKLTFEYRYDYLFDNDSTDALIGAYFNDYGCLRLVCGWKLLLKDFETKYPESVNALVDEWQHKRAALLKLIEFERACTPLQLVQSESVGDSYESLNEDQKDSLILFSIPTLFPNQARRRGVSKPVKGSKLVKPSASECRDAFILLVTCDNDVTGAIERRIAQMKRGGKLQPFVLAVGTSIVTISNCFCVINDVKWSFPTLREALDVCFKCCWAVNAGYGAEAYGPWLFIQQGIYKVFSSADRKEPQVGALLGNFKSFLQVQLETASNSD